MWFSKFELEVSISMFIFPQMREPTNWATWHIWLYIADSILLNTVTAKLQILLSTTTFMLTLSLSNIVNHIKSDPITYIKYFDS